MKNLKRALSFALATVMLIGMMVVGASAAGFGDADEIVNTDAVNTMVALGIIKGKDNGNFDPEGIVTRAEMAKMICVALNGGKDPNLAGGGLYPDTKGHWASGYIDYCTNLGIVAGDTAGNFNPDKTVTGTEAAKMILIALGYNAENEKFVNDANWALNINILASTKGLYEDLAILPAEGLTRDNAAQMIFNGLDATMVKYTYVLNTVDGNLVSVPMAEDVTVAKDTILKAKFGTYTTTPEGVITEIEYANEKWTYTVGGTEFTTDKDFTDLMGMNVKVIAKADTTDKVFGIYASDSKVIAEGYTDALLTVASNKVTLEDTEYSAETLTNYGAMGGAATVGTVAKATLIDKDGNGKVDTVVYLPFTVEKVTFVSDEKIRVTNYSTFTIKDIVCEEGIAKDDIVAVIDDDYTATEKDTIEALEVKTGTVTATKSGKYQIGGKWYTLAAGVTAPTYNDTVDYVALGTVIYDLSVSEGENDSDELALVITAGNVGSDGNVISGADKAVLLFADGTKETVTVSASATDKVGRLVTYYTNSKGKYVLTPVSGSNLAGYDEFETAAVAADDGKVTGTATYELTDDAVVFLFGWKGDNNTTANASNKGKVITGKAAKDLAVANYSSATILGTTVKGFGYANVALLVAANTSVDLDDTASDLVYGYLTADTYTTRENGDYYRNLTIWTAEGEKVVKEKINTTNLTSGTLVSFKIVDETTVESVAVYTAAVADAVVAWNGEKVKFESSATVYEIDEDTVIIYIETADEIGAEGGEIVMADKDENDAWIKNVYVETNGVDKVLVIYVDVNNEIE